jgi:hypothetical protein
MGVKTDIAAQNDYTSTHLGRSAVDRINFSASSSVKR